MPKSIEESLSDTYDALKAEPVEREPADDGLAAPEIEDEPEATDEGPDDGLRVRDERGRFKGKDSAEAEAPPQAASEPEAVSGDQPAPDTQPTEQVAAPQHWSAEHKTKFDALPPAGKALALEFVKLQDADYTRKTQALKPLADLDSHFGPIYSRHGASTAQIAASLLNTHVALMQGTPQSRRQTLVEIGRQFGVDMNAHPGEQPQVDPVQQAVQLVESQYAPRIQTIEARLAAEQDSRNLAAVQTFSATKNADGSPKYPHFDSVVQDMTDLIRSKRGTTMEAAYETAVWSNPTTRAALLKAQAPKPTPAKVPVAAKKAAAKHNMPKSSEPTRHVTKGKTPEDTMRMVYDRMNGSPE